MLFSDIFLNCCPFAFYSPHRQGKSERTAKYSDASSAASDSEVNYWIYVNINDLYILRDIKGYLKNFGKPNASCERGLDILRVPWYNYTAITY